MLKNLQELAKLPDLPNFQNNQQEQKSQITVQQLNNHPNAFQILGSPKVVLTKKIKNGLFDLFF